VLIYAAYLLIWALTVSPISTVLIYHFRMDRGFADAEFLCCGADRGPVFYDVLSQAFRPLLHVTFQNTTLPASCWCILCAGGAEYVRRGLWRIPLPEKKGEKILTFSKRSWYNHPATSIPVG